MEILAALSTSINLRLGYFGGMGIVSVILIWCAKQA